MGEELRRSVVLRPVKLDDDVVVDVVAVGLEQLVRRGIDKEFRIAVVHVMAWDHQSIQPKAGQRFADESVVLEILLCPADLSILTGLYRIGEAKADGCMFVFLRDTEPARLL